jgi:Uncharacterized vancomycin resistance protein
MPFQGRVEKPVHRGIIRKKLGKEYFILKRKLDWTFSSDKYARIIDQDLPYTYISHRSMLLRPLKDVDMYLQHNKITNLRLAIEKINGVIIYPNETFSIWKMIGRPKKRKGYLEGLVLENGTISKGIGGGLCQLGNLLYWMTLHTPLSIIERWRHSYDVFPDVNRTIPFACGATLSYNYVDLKIKNTTNQPFKINLWLDETHLNGSISSTVKSKKKYEVVEKGHLMQLQWWGGYTRHNQIWKEITDLATGEKSEEKVSENHAIMMYNPMLGESTE